MANSKTSKTFRYNKKYVKKHLNGSTTASGWTGVIVNVIVNVVLFALTVQNFVQEIDYGWEESDNQNLQQGIAYNTTEMETPNPVRQNKNMIRTTIVELGKHKGPKKRAIIALDPCADNTNIDEDLARELDLPIVKSGIRR